jgi:hypothetical protein
MKRVSLFILLVFLMFVFSNCVAGPNKLEKTPNTEGKVAGFWKGLWHGLIAPITFIVSIFTKNVRFYEVHNTGFFLSGGILGKGKRAARKRRQ